MGDIVRGLSITVSISCGESNMGSTTNEESHESLLGETVEWKGCWPRWWVLLFLLLPLLLPTLPFVWTVHVMLDRSRIRLSEVPNKKALISGLLKNGLVTDALLRTAESWETSLVVVDGDTSGCELKRLEELLKVGLMVETFPRTGLQSSLLSPIAKADPMPQPLDSEHEPRADGETFVPLSVSWNNKMVLIQTTSAIKEGQRLCTENTKT